MINEIAVRDYFQNLANTSKDIDHQDGKKNFYRWQGADLDEFDNALRTFAGAKGLIIEVGNGELGSEDNVVDHMDVSLWVVIKISGKYDEFDDARQLAKLILKKFMARIKFDTRDKYTRNTPDDGPLFTLGIKFNNSGKYRNLGKLADDLWTGKMIDIKFYGKGDTDNAYNPNDWN